MAANNNIIYPQNHRIFFDGGLNNKFDVNLIPDNESPLLLNVAFDDGAVGTRLGIATAPSWATSDIGSHACDGLFTQTNDQNEQGIVAVYAGDIFLSETLQKRGSQYTPTSWVTGTKVTAAEYQEQLFIGQSGKQPYRIPDNWIVSAATTSADQLFRHGVTAGTLTTGSGNSTNMTFGAGFSSGVTDMSGVYKYQFSFVNTAGVEGDVSSNTTAITATTLGLTVNDLPNPPLSMGIETLNIYRTAADVDSPYQFVTNVTVVSRGGSTDWEDTNPDAALGIAAPIDQGVPPNYSVSLYHQGRLFVIDPDDNLVKYSELGNPYTFKATSFIRLGDQAGDIPIGLDIYDNSLVVLCTRSPWMVYMGSTSDTDWRVLRIRSPYGCASKFGSFKFNNKVMYPAVQGGRFVGFAALEGQTVSPSASLLTNTALGSDLQSTRIENAMKLMNEDLIDCIVSHVYERKAYISIPLDVINTDGTTTYATENNRVLLFDFSMGRLDRKQESSWSLWDNCKFTAFTNYRHSARLKTQIFGGSGLADGWCRELNVEDTYSDDGSTAINSYYYTKKFPGNKRDENFHKDFRYALVLHEISETDIDMNFSYLVDSQSTENTQVVSLTGGAEWGESNWYEFQWSTGEGSREQRLYTAPTYGKRIQFKFDNQNTAGNWFKIYGFNFVYNNKGLR